MKNEENALNKEEILPEASAKGKNKNQIGRVIFISSIIFLLFLTAGTLAGYQGGINLRVKNYEGQVAVAAATQYQYGVIDLEEGRYDIARQRFEYVIGLDPKFPGAAEKLQEALLNSSLEANPTAAPLLPTVVPTEEVMLTPTPDTRTEEELMASVETLLAEFDYVAAIGLLDQLRMGSPEYKTAQVDGMYYIAYRNLGVKRILVEGNLEGGMYDLSIAERFGPLDVEANSYRTYARYYVTGSSFWELDWRQVSYYFSLVYKALPNLIDGSGYTATERFRLSTIYYGDDLYEVGDYCKAQVQYETAYEIDQNVEGLWEKVEKSRENCAEHGDASEKGD